MTTRFNAAQSTMANANISEGDVENLEYELGFLKQKLELLQTLDDEILSKLPDAMADADYQAEFDTANDLLRETTCKVGQIESFISNFKKRQTDASVAAATTGSSAMPVLSSKLPKLNLIHFDGSDIRKWTEFIDCFNAEIHSRHCN